jgi:hypothetical protein
MDKISFYPSYIPIWYGTEGHSVDHQSIPVLFKRTYKLNHVKTYIRGIINCIDTNAAKSLYRSIFLDDDILLWVMCKLRLLYVLFIPKLRKVKQTFFSGDLGR